MAAQLYEKAFVDLNPLKEGKDPIEYNTADAVAELSQMWRRGWRVLVHFYKSEEEFIAAYLAHEAWLAEQAKQKSMGDPPGPKGRHLILTNLQGQTAEEAFATCLELTRKIKGDPDYDEPMPESFKKEWSKPPAKATRPPGVKWDERARKRAWKAKHPKAWQTDPDEIPPDDF